MSGRANAKLAVAMTVAALVVAATSTRADAAIPAAGGVPWTTADITNLGHDVDALIDGASTAVGSPLRGAHVGVFAVDTVRGTLLYDRASQEEYQPASTLKLVVGSLALERLGSDFRFRTTLLDRGGTLVLHGSGDPFFAASDLNDAAPAVRAAGAAAAPIAIDDSHDERRPYPDGWTWDDFAQPYAPRLAATSVDENARAYTVAATAGAAVGSPAHVSGPAGDLPGPDACAEPDQNFVVASVTVAEVGAPTNLDVRTDDAGCSEVVGTIAAGAAAETIRIPVASPAAYARETLLRGLGREPARSALGAKPSDTSPPTSPEAAAASDRLIWTHASAALGDVLGPAFWIPSDNFVAEQLLRELGVAAAGEPGTTAHGLAAERDWLARIGVDPTTVTLADGSGMSQYDRITPRDLVAILQHDWKGPNRATILASLPIGGERGTIEGVAGTPAAGRVYAKTGSMMHVRALAGYLASSAHGAVTFAILIDEWNGADPNALAALRAQVLTRLLDV